MDQTVVAFENALLVMDREVAGRLLLESCQLLGPLPSVEKLVITALDHIGRQWEEGNLALSQVYMSGRICEELVDASLPPNVSEWRSNPTIGIATFEDYHMLGKRIVQSILRSAGYGIVDYGRLDADTALRCVQEDRIQILCLSVLMLNSALHIGRLKREIDRLGIDVKLVVGGAPFRLDQKLGQEVGADAVGRTASDAIEIVRKIAGGARCLR